MTNIIKAEPVAVRPMSYDDLAYLVHQSIPNKNTRAWTMFWVRRFKEWCVCNDVHSFDRRTVLAFRQYLHDEENSDGDKKNSSGTINQALVAIRKLAREGLDNNAMSAAQVHSVCSVAGFRQTGTRAGNWLTKEQAEAVCDAPDPSTLTGARDRAILALLVGAGLRRQEVCDLRHSHLAERGDRLCIVDLVGKGGRVRTVVVLPWVGRRVMTWLGLARTFDGPLLRRIYHGTDRPGRSMSVEGVRFVVEKYSKQVGLEQISAHDLRRTFAKLTKAGGASDRQIMANLGHSNVAVTERYLGTALHLDDPACDHLGLELK